MGYHTTVSVDAADSAPDRFNQAEPRFVDLPIPAHSTQLTDDPIQLRRAGRSDRVTTGEDGVSAVEAADPRDAPRVSCQ